MAKKILIGAGILIVLSIAIFCIYERTFFDCKLKGGDWDRWGISIQKSCNIKMKDGGKECSKKSDCQGTCILNQYQPPFKDPLIGTCSKHENNYGCFYWLNDKGAVDGGICVD